MNSLRNLRVWLAAVPFVMTACGQSTNETAEPAAEAPAPAASAAPAMPRSAAPAGARVYFVAPADGASVSSPVTVEFAVDGMDVVPAGTQADNGGHHHVIIDAELPAMNLPIPADAKHVHFGDGSSSTSLELTPGEHTLQLLFADHLHIPHDPPVYSEKITITVE